MWLPNGTNRTAYGHSNSFLVILRTRKLRRASTSWLRGLSADYAFGGRTHCRRGVGIEVASALPSSLNPAALFPHGSSTAVRKENSSGLRGLAAITSSISPQELSCFWLRESALRRHSQRRLRSPTLDLNTARRLSSTIQHDRVNRWPAWMNWNPPPVVHRSS